MKNNYFKRNLNLNNACKKLNDLFLTKFNNLLLKYFKGSNKYKALVSSK